MISNITAYNSNLQTQLPEPHLLDTLVQPVKSEETQVIQPIKKEVDKNKLLKRARAKYLTNGIIFRLVDTDSKLRKSYWRTYHCCKTIAVRNGKEESRYCKNRWCLVCNRIKTAELIKKHLGSIENFDDPHFVTLTIPNVKAEHLRNSIRVMNTTLTQVRRRLKYHKIQGSGIRKMECTYNSTRDDYHPHFHLIVEGKEYADSIKREWLKSNPMAEDWCQEVIPANDGSVKELFKYFTKLISTKKGERDIYTDKLDTMFTAVKGTRVFQGWGYKADTIKVEQDKVNDMVNDIELTQYYEWSQDVSDWVNVDTGELLSGYTPSLGMKDLVEKRIFSSDGNKRKKKRYEIEHRNKIP